MTRLRRLPKHLRALNPHLDPQTRREAAGVIDVADELRERIRTLAPTLPAPERDYKAGSFKIDLAWPQPLGVAVEVDGGQHAPGGGKHGSVRDYQKIRALVLCGWVVLRFHAEEVRNDPLTCLQDIYAAIGLAKAKV